MGEALKPVLTKDNFISFIAERMGTDFSADTFEISDDFILKIHIDGGQWKGIYQDGYIDYRAAKLVLAIQQDIFHYLGMAAKDNYSYKATYDAVKIVAVRVKIEDGSLTALTNPEVLKAAVTTMKDWQTCLVFFSAVTLGFGYLAFDSYNDRVKYEMTLRADTEKYGQLAKIAEKSLSIVREQQDTLRVISRSMQAGDTFYNENSEADILSKKDLHRFLIRPNPDASIKTLNVDGRFKVKILNFGKSTITIEHGPFRRTAFTKLMNDDSKQMLLDDAKNPIIAGGIPEYNLQTKVTLVDGVISEVYVIGIGEPRSGSRTPLELVQEVREGIE